MRSGSELIFALLAIGLFLAATIAGFALLVRAVVRMANAPVAGGGGSICSRELCGEFNPSGAQFCRRCGARLAEGARS